MSGRARSVSPQPAARADHQQCHGGSRDDPDEIKSLLVRQVTGVVRWRESVAYMVDNGAETLFEIGAGRVLTGIAKRVRAKVDARSIGSPDEVKAFGEWLKARGA